MGFRDDRRAQSIQIGAVLLFGILVVLLASYQAFVVPDQNREVEFKHNQDVQGDIQELRNAIVSGDSDTTAVTVRLGTQYPSRVFAVNPPPPAGSVRTQGTGNKAVELAIRNASVSGEAGDYWNGSRAFGTGQIVYRPSYYEYRNAPETVYGQTTLYNRFGSENITLANQTFIDGTELSLVVLNGSLSRTASGTASIEVDRASASSEPIDVTDNSSGPLTIEFVTTRPASYWDFLTNSQSSVTAVRDAATTPPAGYYTVAVELDDSRTYSLRMTKVGVGTGVTDEDTAYLTDTEGNGGRVTQGETIDLTLAVRDRYGGPPDNATETTVDAEIVGSGTLGSGSQTASKTPGPDGTVTFTYTAPAASSGTTGTQELRFSYGGLNDGTFADGNAQDARLSVDVQQSGGSGGSGAFAVSWSRPGFSELIASSANGTLTGSTYRGSPFLARAEDNGDGVSGLSVDYSVTNETNASVAPSSGNTNMTGYNETRVLRDADGRSGVFVAAGGDSDKTAVSVDRILNESFEDGDDETLIANGWTYESTDGDAGVVENTSGDNPLPGDHYAFIDGSPKSASQRRAIELNYSLDTSEYDALTLTYIAREPGSSNGPSGSSTDTSENLSVAYLNNNDNWVTVDDVSSGNENANPIEHYRRVRIESVGNASHQNFKLNFSQGEADVNDRWQIDAVELVGISTATVSDLNQAPKAQFRYAPENPTTGETITFYGNRSDDPDGDDITGNSGYLNYEWDFNTSDSTNVNKTGERVTTSYSSDGTKTVTLLLTDDRGATDTATQDIVVSGSSSSPLQYKTGSGKAVAPSGSTKSGLEFTIENTGSNEVDVTGISVDSTGSSTSATTVKENNGGNGQYNREAFFNVRGSANKIDNPEDGYAETGSGIQIGGSVEPLDDLAQIPSGESSDTYIYRFRDSNDDPVDMKGTTVTVTVEYDVDGGGTGSQTFTVTT